MADTLGRQNSRLFLSGKSDRVNQFAFISLLDGKNNAFMGLNAGSSLPGTNNTFLGSYSGSNATTIDGSVFMGMASGRRAHRVKESMFLGYKTGELADRVESSVSIGAYAGRKMQRANCNTLIGFQSGAELTSGSRNTILGSYAGFSQFNAHDNVCIGHRSGYKNTIGSNNCYIGTNSGFAAYQGYENVALGVKSGEGLTSGRKNVLLGYSAGANISGASNCIAIGTQAMEFFNTGDTNTCIGTQAAKSFTGVNNTILGGYSTSNASGNFNTIVGSRSMNRRSGDRVALSNCVILGENIQFDIPVRRVTAYPKDMDITPEAQLDNEYPETSMLLSTPSRTFTSLNLVPIGDPILIKERYISLGTYEHPVNFDTTNTGTYIIQWGSQIADDDTLLGPIPVRFTIDVNSDVIIASLEVYEDSIQRWTLDVAPTVNVHLAQAFNPPSIRVFLQTDTETIDDTLTTLELPGVPVALERVPSYDGNFITLYATSNTHLLVPGMEVQISNSAIDGLNTAWRIAEIGPSEFGGIVPVMFNIEGIEGITGSDLGMTAVILVSRTVSRPEFGNVVQNSVSVKEPYFAGMLYGTLTEPSVYVDGSGDISEGVYPITITSAERGEFAFSAFDASDSQNVFFGNVTIGSFESLIVGLEIKTSTDISGPTISDGHVHSGVGSQEQMDAGLMNGYLTFVGGGFEYATYEFPGTTTNVVDVSGSFDIPLSEDIDCGFKWMDVYDVKCLKVDTSIGFSITSLVNGIQRNVINFSTDVEVIGSIEASDFPVDVTELLATPDPQMSVRIQHDTLASTLTFTVTLQGGTRFGKVFVPQGRSYIAKIIVGQVPTPQILGSTVVYYANAPTKLSDVSITTNEQTFDISTLDDFTITYSQRSDTGLQKTGIDGPSAFDGHTHRGDGTADDMDQDIRDNILTFASTGFSAADYTIGSLGTSLKTSVTFAWAETSFGIEWLDYYHLECTGSDSFGLELYHTNSQKFLASFTPQGMFGRVKATIAQYDEDDVQIPMVYPLNTAVLNPQTVTIDINHDIREKLLLMVITVIGATEKVVYTIYLTDTPPVNRFSDTLSYFSYGATTARDIVIVQYNYQAYPTFADCIFVGSNFTVGGDEAIVDKERSNVFIAAIGDTRLFRGRLEEFVFFSNVVTANALNLQGSVDPGQATLVISGNESGNALQVDGNMTVSGTVDVLGASTFGNSFAVTGSVAFGDSLSVSGQTTISESLVVSGPCTFENTLTVTDEAVFQNSMTIAGSCDITGAVSLYNTLDVSGDLTANKSADIKGNVSIDGTLDVGNTASFENNVNIAKSLDVTQKVDIGGAATVDGTLEVNGVMTVNNSLNVDLGIIAQGLTVNFGDVTADGVSLKAVESRMDTAESDINAVESRLSTAETDINAVESRMSTAESDINNVESRVSTAESDINNVETRVSIAENDINNVEYRVGVAENDINNVENSLAGKYNTSGGTVSGSVYATGSLSASGGIYADYNYVTYTPGVAALDYSGRVCRSALDYLQRSELNGYATTSSLNSYLLKSGGTMSGSLVIQGDGGGGGGQLVMMNSGSGTTAVVTENGNRLVKQSSSIRYKRNITPMSADILWNVEPVLFYYKDGPVDRRHGGFIAEQLDSIGFREGVFYENERPEALLPDGILALAVAGIQELRAQVQRLEMQINHPT